MNTELYIENFRLDLTADLSALLTFAIDDIKDFSARSTTWSKTIVLPGTANNNKLFGHIFQIGQTNAFDPGQDNVGYNFNASKSADCIIFQDQMQTFKGVLRLLQINITNGRIEYEVSVFGKLAGLNVALSSALLEDLDFSAYDHVYNDANIVSSWDNAGGTGIYYPLIDYGAYSLLKHDWDIRTFRPALYAREYIAKIFIAAGYRFQSDLFETDRFKKLIIPHNKKTLTSIETELLNVFDEGERVLTTAVVFDILTELGLFTPGGGNTTFTYTGGSPSVSGNLELDMTGEYYSELESIFIYIKINGTIITTIPLDPTNNTTFAPFTFDDLGVTGLVFSPGDVLSVELGLPSFGLFSIKTTSAHMRFQSDSGQAVPISPGDTVQMNQTIPQNIRQIDFILGIVKLFNLYCWEDKFDPSLIYFKPYVDYYSTDTSNSLDWTYKLNRDKPIKIKPMSELNAKIYNFRYKQDSDYYNDLYRKRYGEGYGDYTYDSLFEFTAQKKEFEIIFSATPLVGYNGEDKVYSTIFKRTGSDTSPVEENTDCNIRILQTKKVTGITLWTIKDGGTVLNSLTKYGYAGHLNDPDVPSNDINFGALKELFFILVTGNLSNTQFNIYWSSYMAEITDKDSKLMTANFYLTPKDILLLDFSIFVYIDGVLFRLNKIKDYNASKPMDCQVELLKVNFANYSSAGGGDSLPIGNFLLWTNDETLDWNTADEITYN